MTPTPEATATAVTGPVLDVVVPVYNEEHDLVQCVRKLHANLSERFPYPFRITIADNASTDRTAEIADALADEIAEVRAVHLPPEGPWSCAQGGLVVVRRRGARVYGRGRVH